VPSTLGNALFILAQAFQAVNRLDIGARLGTSREGETGFYCFDLLQRVRAPSRPETGDGP